MRCGVDVGLVPAPRSDPRRTFAVIMIHTATRPEDDPLPPDEFDRLEEMNQRLKEKQEAWRNLLESLGDLKKKNTDKPDNEKPSA